jgi:hypothetical protein
MKNCFCFEIEIVFLQREMSVRRFSLSKCKRRFVILTKDYKLFHHGNLGILLDLRTNKSFIFVNMERSEE